MAIKFKIPKELKKDIRYLNYSLDKNIDIMKKIVKKNIGRNGCYGIYCTVFNDSFGITALSKYPGYSSSGSGRQNIGTLFLGDTIKAFSDDEVLYAVCTKLACASDENFIFISNDGKYHPQILIINYIELFKNSIFYNMTKGLKLWEKNPLKIPFNCFDAIQTPMSNMSLVYEGKFNKCALKNMRIYERILREYGERFYSVWNKAMDSADPARRLIWEVERGLH